MLNTDTTHNNNRESDRQSVGQWLSKYLWFLPHRETVKQDLMGKKETCKMRNLTL
jgi:hypothetical protein